MIKKQYTIGEFASLNRITPRRLRHYDQIGLLKPSLILENGYRVYTSDQVLTVSKILMLQDCHFTLSEINDVLSMKRDEKEIGKKKLLEFELKEIEDLNAKEKLMKIIDKSFQNIENHYDIVFIEQSKKKLLCSKTWIIEEKVEEEFEQLYKNLGEGTTGFMQTILDFENAKYRVAIEKEEDITCDGYEIISIEAGWYLSTFHYGDYYNIGEAYDKLFCYADKKKYKFEGNFIERYLIDSSHAFSSSQYITQILIKFIS